MRAARVLNCKAYINVGSEFVCLICLEVWGGGGCMNTVIFEIMQYFGLNHKPSSKVKWKFIKLCVTFTLKSQINTEYKINWCK